jgi:hypothetical protein
MRLVIIIISFFALCSCKKEDARENYVGNYTCTYESSAGISEIPASITDTSYQIAVELLIHEEDQFILTGDKYEELYFDEESLRLSEDWGGYNIWNGAFQTANNFELSKGTSHMGHFTSASMNCSK